MKLRKGDSVIVVAGKDKGKKGKIDKTFPSNDTVVIANVNMYKRHLKRKDEKNPGGIIDVARPLSVAKVALICSKCKMQTRIGYELTGKGKRRICRKCNQGI